MGKEKIRGFTLVEILVALTIIGIISSFATVQLTQGQARARDAQRKTDLQQLVQALESYYNDNGRYVNGDTCLFYEKISAYTKTLKTPVDPKFGTDGTDTCPDAKKYYYYQTDDRGGSYRLFTRLENCNDPQVIDKDTCSQDQYNYSITSGNISTVAYVTPAPTSTPTLTPVPTVTPTPIPTKRVFVTGATWNGNLGGLSGADAKCQQKADEAGLGGAWKAWLSDNTTSAASRLEHFNGLYLRTDGSTIASNWADLTDGSLDNAINKTERGQGVVGLEVWTNTNPNGSIYSTSGTLCLLWGSGDGSNDGLYGDAFQIDDSWTRQGTQRCNRGSHLYCFEQ